MQAVEGYVEKGNFYPLGQIFNVPEKRRAFVMITDEPVKIDSVAKDRDDAIATLWEELKDTPPLPDEFDAILNQRVNITRELEL